MYNDGITTNSQYFIIKIKLIVTFAQYELEAIKQ